MFCNQCGNNIPDGADFCSNCGAAAMTAPMAPAAPKAKKNALPCILAGLLAVILVVVSALAPFVRSFNKIPVVTWIAGDAADEMDEELDELAENFEELEDESEEALEELDDDEREAVENLMKKTEKMIDNCSLMNINAAVKAMEEVGDEYQDSSLEDLGDTMTAVMSVVITICAILFFPGFLLALLSATLKKPGLTIAAMILTAIAQLILSGMVFVLLSLAINIVLIILQKKYRAE